MAWNRPRFDSFFPSAPDSRGPLDPYGEEIGAAPFEQFLQPAPVPWPNLPSHLSWGALPPPDVPRLPPYVPGYVPLPALSFGPDFDESRQPSDHDQRAIRTLPYDLRQGRGGPSTFPYFPDGAAPEPFDLGPLSQPGPWFSPYFYDPRVPMLDRAPDALSPLMQPLSYSATADGPRGGAGVTIPLPPQTWPIPPETPAPPAETPAWETLYPSGGVLDPTHQAAYDPWEQLTQQNETSRLEGQDRFVQKTPQIGATADWPLAVPEPVSPDAVRLWRVLKGLAEEARSKGYDLAPAHLEHFLGASGAPMILSRDTARPMEPFRRGERILEGRYERSFVESSSDYDAIPDATSPERTMFGDKLRSLKDGESRKIKDNWSAAYDNPLSKYIRGGYNLDFDLAFGNTSLRSDGEFTVTRRGDTIYVEGVATHKLKDPYDFDAGGSYGDDALWLERQGMAKRFDRTAEWKRRLTGTIELKNGRLQRPRFVWEDID